MAKKSSIPDSDTIPPPDVTIGSNPITETPEAASIFDTADIVTPSPRTEGAVMPGEESRPEKRGRGRPRKDGADTRRSHKKKSPAQAESEGMASAQLIVGALDLVRRGIGGAECPENVELRAMTVEAWREYLAQNNWEVPAWVQVAVISSMYVAPAFSTPAGSGKISGMWARAKGWWIARKG